MGEFTYDVKVREIAYKCDECVDGEMIYEPPCITPFLIESIKNELPDNWDYNKLAYKHRCNKCDIVKYLDKGYPYKEHKRIPDI